MSTPGSEPDAKSELAEAIWGTLESPNEPDREDQPSNVVDGLYAIARAIERLASAIEGLTGGVSPFPEESPRR
jgi:hypothetical protein